ncbi:MAG: decarboxylating NADP(+)-dependent phosphogluconate dehydrogenase [Chlamydiota bacterium]
MSADIGLIGLAVMGQNLILNMADHGYKVAAFNRTLEKVKAFEEGPAKGKSILCAKSLEEFLQALKRPRKVMLMVKAGPPVDAFIEKLLPHLDPGDIVIDGGNSLYSDTQRRYEELKSRGILFVGTGISGGEEGARHGPSIMPGGHPSAWPEVKDIFQSIAAKSQDGQPCCDWVGEGGSGHYVKMVHNGIEYGDMQLICESFDLMLNALGKNYPELTKIFSSWNERELDSYLIEITSHILQKKDLDGKYVLDKILDVAGQKGTGKWTGIEALDQGIPVTLIAEAVFARCLSSLYEERQEAASLYAISSKKASLPTEKIEKALYASKIISYAQGFMLMRAASEEHKWRLNYASIALMWRGGCIIRSKFLGKIGEAYQNNPNLKNLLLDPFFAKELQRIHEDFREVVAFGATAGIPLPGFSSALSFFLGYLRNRLPANLLQALRDYFGAHTYERVDAKRGEFFHTSWTDDSGDVSSSSYNA